MILKWWKRWRNRAPTQPRGVGRQWTGLSLDQAIDKWITSVEKQRKTHLEADMMSELVKVALPHFIEIRLHVINTETGLVGFDEPIWTVEKSTGDVWLVTTPNKPELIGSVYGEYLWKG